MKAIVLHQPYASLVIAGVKEWETRPSPPNGSMRPEGVRGLPGLGIEPGERVAIVAGAKPPEGGRLGDWDVVRHADDGMHWPHTETWLNCGDWYTYRRPRWRGLVHDVTPLPLGAVLGTVEVVEALPMVAETGDNGAEVHLTVDGRDLAVQRVLGDPGYALNVTTEWITDQLPLGDWAPGRWAWRLANPEPLPSPVPCKGKQGVFWIEDPR